MLDGHIIGYDPGGNEKHGLAVLEVASGTVQALQVMTVADAEAVIRFTESLDTLIGLGVDTLVSWGTGKSGYRPADLWLRTSYPAVRNSVVSPNGLYGSMGLNGMAVVHSARMMNPDIALTETHPKVLYWALAGEKYDYNHQSARMDDNLSQWLGLPVSTENDHEWDAAVSALAAMKGLIGSWKQDLFEVTGEGAGRLVFPAGPAHYWWPD